jgi:4-amino-4-deoxy-L-arabinose transferase-like glycosyltransferase
LFRSPKRRAPKRPAPSRRGRKPRSRAGKAAPSPRAKKQAQGLDLPPYAAAGWSAAQLALMAGVLAAAALLAFGWLGRPGLAEPGESLVAQAGREMLAQGSWLGPRLNGEPHLDAPPLPYWLSAAGQALGGATTAGARGGAATCAVLAVAAVCLLGRALGGGAAGLWAGLVLAASAGPALWARAAGGDSAYLLAAALAGWGLWRARFAGLAGPLAFWLGCSLAFWDRGLAGLALPWALALAFAGLAGEPRLLRSLARWPGPALFAVLAGAWGLPAAWSRPELWAAMWPWSPTGAAPPWMALALLPVAALPWAALWPWAGAKGWPGGGWRTPGRRPWLFLALWLVLAVAQAALWGWRWPAAALAPAALMLGEALAQGGRVGWREWAEPWLRAGLTCLALACLAVGAALWLGPAWGLEPGGAVLAGPLAGAAAGAVVFGLRARRWAAWAMPLAVFVLAAAGAAAWLPGWAEDRSLRSLAAPLASELRAGDRLASYGGLHPGLLFYARRPATLVGGWEPLRPPEEPPQGPRWISGNGPFIQALQSPGRRWVALGREKDFQALRRQARGAPGLLLFEWGRSGSWVLFSNRPR